MKGLVSLKSIICNTKFGQFCENHGLEVVTNEIDVTKRTSNEAAKDISKANGDQEERQTVVKFASAVQVAGNNVEINDIETPPLTIETKPARHVYFSEEAEKLQAVNRLTDMIRGYDPSEPLDTDTAPKEAKLAGPTKVVVVVDTKDFDDVVIVGINANDRPGLLLDISRLLHRLGLQLHHTEASVILNRSISIWRCALIDVDSNEHPDEETMQEFLRVSFVCYTLLFSAEISN